MRSDLRLFCLAAIGAASLGLAGCGGGGGSDPAPTNTTATTTSFPLLAAYKAQVAAGTVTNYTVSGSCTGTVRSSDSAPVSATFEGVAGYSVTMTQTWTLTNCTPKSIAATGVSYYDTNYTYLGASEAGSSYDVVSPAAPTLPVTVRAGDTAQYATVKTFTDSSRTVPTGQDLLSYVIEADTATSVVCNLIRRSYNASGHLEHTQQSRYRLMADGVLTPVSIDIQYSTSTNTNHFVLTAI